MKRLLSTSKFVVFQALNEKLLRCQSPAELENLILTTPLAMFNDVNCSTAITMLGRRKSTNTNAIDTCLFIAKSKRFLPRHLSNICFGIANGKLCPQLPGFLVKQIPANLSSFNTQDLANTLWSLARLQYAGNEDAELVERFARHLIDKPNILIGKHTDLSLLLWSFVTLGYCNDVLFRTFAKQITASSQGVGGGVWRAHNMANCLWAFATAGHPALDVCELFAREISRTGASEFNPQDLANTIWAFSTLRFKYEPSLVALADKVCKRELGAAPPQHARNSIALTPHSSPSFVSELMQKLKPPSSVFASSAKYKLPILLERLEGKPPPPQQQPIGRLQSSNDNCFTPQNLTSTLISFANLGFYHVPVIESIASEVCARTLQEFQSQNLFNLLWAFACLNSLELPRVKDFFNLLPAPEFEIEYQLEQAQQLFQVHLAWKQQSHRGTRPSALLDAVSDHDWYLALVRQQQKPSSSQAHLNIAQLLTEQFSKPGELVNETSVCDGGISVDILLPKHQCVIEIDGPTHFLHTVDDNNSSENEERGEEEEERTGRTLFKHRLLRGEGYSVCSISVRKFEATPRKRIAIAVLAKGILLRNAA
ncbi:hypothetical protein BASA81_008282 [Batrachochytrium salamandrivorans]|nr:hypothetical protein BASA81_008282 [Batrachochytrium salamandrivorans]